MTRYVVKKNGKWAVVNANYKKSIKGFDTQKEAIKFSKELLDTKHVVIQGNDGKFRRVENGTKPEKRVIAPGYVYKSLDDGSYKKRMIETSIIAAAIAMFAIMVVFIILYAKEAL